MIFKCVGTGSSGNCYIISNKIETIVIETGLPFKKILRAIDYNIKNVSGVVVSHSHLDHSKSIDDFNKCGIQVFDAYKNQDERQKRVFGNFTIYSFPLVHDVPCCGFYIMHPDMGTLVYISDTEYCKYRFKDVNHILIEANYDKRMIDINHPAREHILRGHLELKTTKEFVRINKTTNLRNVILCHLSQENADPDVMQKEIQEVAGPYVNVFVAEKGIEIQLGKYPF